MYDIISRLICIFYTFSNLNISGTNAGICKQLTACSFFHRILCDKPKKSRGKRLFIVALFFIKTSDKILRHLDLAEIIFKFKKKE